MTAYENNVLSLTMFLSYPNLAMHNLNTGFMFVEFFLSRWSIQSDHLPSSWILGLFYAVFAWIWLQTHKIVYYPFVDPTMPLWKCLVCHIGLVSVFSVFFKLAEALESISGILRAPVLLASFACLIR